MKILFTDDNCPKCGKELVEDPIAEGLFMCPDEKCNMNTDGLD